MDHAEARELIELATPEPGGFERLMAGDTPDAAALAAHIAGCPDCAAGIERLRRDGRVIREVVRSAPPPDLRERTLAYVRELGRDRNVRPEGVPVAIAAAASGRIPGPAQEGHGAPAFDRRLGLLAAIAAVLVLAVVGAGAALLSAKDEAIAERDAEIARQVDATTDLRRIATWTLKVDGQPDVRRVALTAAPGHDANGTIVFSPATGELVVVAEGLTEPAAGRQLRCWVEVDGQRQPVGRMFFGGGLSYWAGSLEGLKDVAPGAQFGVSLVDDSGMPVDGDPVLTGTL